MRPSCHILLRSKVDQINKYLLIYKLPTYFNTFLVRVNILYLILYICLFTIHLYLRTYIIHLTYFLHTYVYFNRYKTYMHEQHFTIHTICYITLTTTYAYNSVYLQMKTMNTTSRSILRNSQ